MLHIVKCKILALKSSLRYGLALSSIGKKDASQKVTVGILEERRFKKFVLFQVQITNLACDILISIFLFVFSMSKLSKTFLYIFSFSHVILS